MVQSTVGRVDSSPVLPTEAHLKVVGRENGIVVDLAVNDVLDIRVGLSAAEMVMKDPEICGMNRLGVFVKETISVTLLWRKLRYLFRDNDTLSGPTRVVSGGTTKRGASLKMQVPRLMSSAAKRP